MVKAVIFDMDGVIVDSEKLIREAEVEAFNKFGVPVTLEIVADYTGVRLEEMVEDINKRFGVSVSAKKVREFHDKNMDRYFREIIPLVPHIEEVLKDLSSKYKLGLATMRDKEVARSALQRFNLLSFFQALTFARDVKKAKPDPQAFLRTAKLLGIDPKNCAVVEDSSPGLKAGKAAGMMVIARKAEHNKNADFSPADFVVEDMKAIPGILLR